MTLTRGHPLAGLAGAGSPEGLAESAAEVPKVFDEPPGSTVGVEVVVVGEAGQLVEDVARGVQQPVLQDLGVAELGTPECRAEREILRWGKVLTLP